MIIALITLATTVVLIGFAIVYYSNPNVRAIIESPKYQVLERGQGQDFRS